MKRIFACILFLCHISVHSSVYNSEETEQLKELWQQNMLNNGAIIASPSRQHPDYYYDWVRDSAIAMGLISQWYQASHDQSYQFQLYQYVSWVELTQKQISPHGVDVMGEPKFYVSGDVYDGAWARPQNDGPALRAMALVRFANTLLDRGEKKYVEQHLYQSTLHSQAMGVIKKDLEYIAHHWQDANFDLWEEVYGHHFFTAMVQRRALLEGSKLAIRMSDPEAASYYQHQVQLLNQRVKQHLNHSSGLIDATFSPHPGPQKWHELDSAVLLAVLLTQGEDNLIDLDDIYLKNTINELHKYFKSQFPVNQSRQDAVLFGRYPGDTYDGYQTNGQGNPWFILTATMAEYYYVAASQLAIKQGTGQKTKYMAKQGEAYLRLVKQFAPKMRMKEQINLSNGEQQGADSLTWNYTALLRAIDAEKHYEQLIIRTSK